MSLNPLNRRRSAVTFALVVGISASSLRAQAVLMRWDGDHQDNNLGSAIAVLPDVTGDGIPDALVGEVWGDCGGTDYGAAYVYSGGDGTTYLVNCGTGAKFESENFGWAVDEAGDVDGDGVADFLVGGPSYHGSGGGGAGRVCVYSGKSGALLYQREGERIGYWFGSSVAGLGDIDGDGRGDWIAGAYGYSNTYPYNIGRAYVYSGATGTLLRYHEGEEEYDKFGWNSSGIGDVDADGVPDYAVMAEDDRPTMFVGVVFVYSGKSGTPLYRWAGDATHYFLGTGMDGRLDWNGDGFGDVLVGAPSGIYTDGHVYIYSGKDGSTLATVVGETFGTQFGYSVANVGDMNGDGYPEILVGEPKNSELKRWAGRATLLSGRSLRRLYHFYGSGAKDIQFGIHVAGGQDYNGDGIPDVMISEPMGSFNIPQGGRATVFAGNDLFLQAIPNDVTAGDTLVVDTRGGEPGALALLAVLDVSGIPIFFALQLGTLDGNGEMELAGTVPSGLAGITVTLQSFAQKPAGMKGYVDSDRETISIY